MQDSIHPEAADPLTASAPARRRNTRERGPGRRMRRKLAQPDRSTTTQRQLRDHRGSSATTTVVRRVEPRPPPGAGSPGAARVRQVHARQRRAQLPRPERRRRRPLLRGCRNQSRRRPRSRRRRRSARSSCPAAAPLAPARRRTPPHRRWRSCCKIARCMRQHGVPQFPDPRTSVPSNPLAPVSGEITDFDGAILLFPATINMQAPAYKQALAACGAPPLGLPH